MTALLPIIHVSRDHVESGYATVRHPILPDRFSLSVAVAEGEIIDLLAPHMGEVCDTQLPAVICTCRRYLIEVQ